MDLTRYMNDAIERIVGDALRASLRNPRESAFLLRFGAARKKEASLRAELEAAGKHVPPFLIASIASRCNLHCAGCYARANGACSDGSFGGELSAREWERIFGQARELGISFILLAGGEPFLREDVLLAASGFPEIVFPIFTNGTMMDGGRLALLNKSRNLVPVLSIEGGRERTDARRGPGTFDGLERAMDSLNELGVFYGASVTVTKENLGEVAGEEFVGRLRQKGCRLVFYVEYVPAAVGTEDLAPAQGEREFLSSALDRLRERCGDTIFLSFPGDEEAFGGCLAAGRGFFHINPRGGAEPCPFSPYSDTSLKDCSLSEALESPLFRKLSVRGMLSAEHAGGCALFGREEAVEKLLSEPF